MRLPLSCVLNLRQHAVEAGDVGQLSSGELRRRKQQSDGDQGTPEQLDHADGTENSRLSKNSIRLDRRRGEQSAFARTGVTRSRASAPMLASRLPTRKIDPAAQTTGQYAPRALEGARRDRAPRRSSRPVTSLRAIAASSSAVCARGVSGSRHDHDRGRRQQRLQHERHVFVAQRAEHDRKRFGEFALQIAGERPRARGIVRGVEQHAAAAGQLRPSAAAPASGRRECRR